VALWGENDLERFSLKQTLHEVESSVLFATITEAFLRHIPSTCYYTSQRLPYSSLFYFVGVAIFKTTEWYAFI